MASPRQPRLLRGCQKRVGRGRLFEADDDDDKVRQRISGPIRNISTAP